MPSRLGGNCGHARTEARKCCQPYCGAAHGSCSRSSAGFTINIGTVVLGNAKKKPEYFGITVAAKPGSHSNSAAALVHANKSYAVLGTVALTAGLKSGSFSGKVFGSPTKIAGSFHC